MDTLLTRSLARAAAFVAAVVVGVAILLVLFISARQADLADRQDVAAVSAVVAITDDRDQVRAAIARTSAGAEGRLAVHLSSGGTVGTSRAAAEQVTTAAEGGAIPEGWHAVPGRAVVELSAGAPVVDSGLLLGVAALLVVGTAAVVIAVVVSRNEMASALRGLRALIETARHGAIRVRITGPAELVAVADMVNELADRAERLLAGEREMVADVSHRLRTPLTALRLEAESLGDSPAAQRILGLVATLDQAVDQIICSVHPTRTESSTCDLGQVVRDRMSFWGVHATNQRRTWDVDVPGVPLLIAVGADVLAAAVDTVLDNVFQHTPPGTPIAVEVVEHAGWITLVVEDGGLGVAAPQRATERGISGGGSTGLGLAIARTAAEATGGSLHVEQGRLGGARIRLRFGAADRERAESRPLAWRLWQGTARRPRPTS